MTATHSRFGVLRSQGAMTAAAPIIYLAVVATFGLLPFSAPGWLRALSCATTAISYGMWFWAEQARPWPKLDAARLRAPLGSST